MRIARVEKRQNLTALAALPENALAALGDVLIAIAAGAQQDVPAGKALVIENDDLIMPRDKAQQTKDTDDSGDGRQIGLLRQQKIDEHAAEDQRRTEHQKESTVIIDQILPGPALEIKIQTEKSGSDGRCGRNDVENGAKHKIHLNFYDNI